MKVSFPGGKEVTMGDLISFIYGLPKSDIDVLQVLISQKRRMSSDEIADVLKVSKASINKSLNNLYDKGLILREKEEAGEEKKKGRPSYIYWVDGERLYEKLERDLETLASQIKKELEERMQSI